MEHRVGKENLLQTLSAWDELLPGRGRIHLIACGGTALTLLGYKESTKDVDLLVPEENEYSRLIRFLARAGYEKSSSYGWKIPSSVILYDLYPGKAVYTTELLSSPLEREGNRKIKAWKSVYLGVLNSYDLIISKMFRGSQSDIDDCLLILEKERVSLKRLKERYAETAKYEVSEEKVLRNLDLLLSHWTRLRRGRR